MFEIADPFFQVTVDLAADATVSASFGYQAFESSFFIAAEPFLDGRGSIMVQGAIGSPDTFGGNIPEIGALGFVIAGSVGDQWGNGGIAHQSDRLFSGFFHDDSSPFLFFLMITIRKGFVWKGYVKAGKRAFGVLLICRNCFPKSAKHCPTS